jgi:hypothetical protein
MASATVGGQDSDIVIREARLKVVDELTNGKSFLAQSDMDPALNTAMANTPSFYQLPWESGEDRIPWWLHVASIPLFVTPYGHTC